MVASSHRRWLILAAILSVALVAVGLLVLVASRHSVSPHGSIYPSELPGGYHVVAVINGSRAVEAVKKLHMNPGHIDVVEAYIVKYSDGTILWISRVRGDACEAVKRMAEVMTRLASMLPYTAPTKHVIGGVEVYLTLDKRDGSIHAFWCRGDYSVWARVAALNRKEAAEKLAYLLQAVATS